MAKKIVIVGGVGGGATVAAQIRRMDKESEIILFEKGNYIAFSNCGMPYYIGGIINDRDDLLVGTEKFANKYGVTVKSNTEVTSINRIEKQIEYEDKNGIHESSYDTLILSPGASAITPKFDGLNKNRTFTLHTIPDMDRIYTYIRENKPKSCAIVGAGFIGMEMVENLVELGIDCTVLDRSKQVMKLVDEDMAAIIQDHMREKGVNLILEDGLDAFSNNGTTLHLVSGKSLQADMTILATGIKPNTQLATTIDLETGKTGALTVNKYMQTKDPDIYALGDVVETNDYLTNTPRHVALAWPAHRQAYIIASHLQGRSLEYNGTQGSAIFKVFELSVATTGYNQDALNNLGIKYKVITHKSLSHAGYYPGAKKVHIKVIFNENDGTIYGAQIIGKDGVDKRIGIIVTAMKGKLSAADLAELELPYAPPYSSPKDPINIVGYKVAGILGE